MSASSEQGAGPDAGRKDADTPWYVDVFLAFGGWLGGLLAAFAIFAFGLALFASAGVLVGWVAAAMGLAFIAGGTASGARGRSAFGRHFRVAIVAAGLTAFDGGLAWILVDALKGEQNARAAGVSLAVVAAAHALISAFAARRLEDRILTYLATLAGVLIAAAAAGLVVGGDAFAGRESTVLMAIGAAVGAVLAVSRGARGGLAVGAAMMTAPMLFGAVLESAGGLASQAHGVLPAPPWSEAVYAAGAVFCLAALLRKAAFPAVAAAGLVILAFIVLTPDRGAASALLLVAGMAAGSRALAAVGVVATAWFLSRYYYDLSLPLLQKSALLGGLGLVTIVVAEGLRRFAGRRPQAVRGARKTARRGAAATLAFGGLLLASALLVNRSVIRLESDFASGREVYLKLAPVDPRSMLQGDYMALNFDASLFPPETVKLDRRGEIFLALDADGVARFSRVAGASDQPHTDEVRVDYALDGARPRYCPGSYFFQEGEAGAYAGARYAVLLVAPDGKTRLVALADADRRRIAPKPAPRSDAAPPA